MKFKDFLLEEMFQDDNGYKTVKFEVGKETIFDLSTDEIRDYRFKFLDKDNGNYIGVLGYKGKDKSDIVEIRDDFYDTPKLISSLIGIFTGFYVGNSNVNTVIYKFQEGVDKSYKLLVNSIFKKELKNYYTIVPQETSDYGSIKYIVLNTNRRSGQQLSQDQIENLI